MGGVYRRRVRPFCLLLMEELVGRSAYVDGLLQVPFNLQDGLLAIPDGPGLGVLLDREQVARCTPAASPRFEP